MKTMRYPLAGLTAAAAWWLLCGCAVSLPSRSQGAGTGLATLRVTSNVTLLSIDGQPQRSRARRVELEPGHHVIIAEYTTMTARYRCRFEQVMEGGHTYEVMARSDRYPVSLNRLKRGLLFSRRTATFPPVACVTVSERGGTW
jgi:hypothetical protein